MDPWYGMGSGDMLEVAHMGLHVAQMTSQKGTRACYGAVTVNAGFAMRPHLLARQIYGSGLKPSSCRKPLCFCFAVAMAFSISTNSPCVDSRLISAAPTDVLM